MAIPRTPMTDDDGTGTTGTILNAAWKTELYDQIDQIGTWVSVPHASMVYTAVGGGGGTWVVEAADQQAMRYTVIGRTIVLSFGIIGSSITGSPTMLRITLPGILATALFLTTCRIQSAGVETVGRVYAYTGVAYLSIEQTNSAVIPAQTNTLLVQGELYFEATSSLGLAEILSRLFPPEYVPDITQPAPPLEDLIVAAGGDPLLARRPPVIRA